MEWTHIAYHYIAYAACGAFLTNSIPHLVSGVMGRPFQTPFAKPRGEGVSSSTVNVLWGFCNLVFAYFLISRAGAFDLHAMGDAVAVGLGIFLAAIGLARRFGRFNGGNAP